MSRMKFSTEQVLAVLERESDPQTTSDVRESCNLASGRGRYDGSNADVRDALDALVAAGTVVTAHPLGYLPTHAEREAAAANPYYFICGGDGRATYWMTRANADAYRQAQERERADTTAAREKVAEVCRLLGGGRGKAHAHLWTGEVRFELSGDGDALDRLLAALRAQAPADNEAA